MAQGRDRAEVNRRIEALLTTAPNPDQPFQLYSVSYYPSVMSSIHDHPKFIRLSIEYGSIFRRRPLGGRAEGSVVIGQTTEGIYTAELDLIDANEHFISQFSRSMQADVVRLADLPIPEVALKPNTQLITGHSNSPGAVYTVYTRDQEGSHWSLHINKEGLRPLRGQS